MGGPIRLVFIRIAWQSAFLVGDVISIVEQAQKNADEASWMRSVCFVKLPWTICSLKQQIRKMGGLTKADRCSSVEIV